MAENRLSPGRDLSLPSGMSVVSQYWLCVQAARLCSQPRPPPARDYTLTGTPVIDDQLQVVGIDVLGPHSLIPSFCRHCMQALQYGMRDFVQSWFHVWVSPDPTFPNEVERAVAAMVADLTKR